MQSNKRRTIATAAMIAVALSIATSLALTGQAFADDNNGLVVPIYGWDAGWNELIKAKHENSDTKIITIINPSSGPGSEDSHWKSVVNDLQDAGIRVVGYVATSYAGRSLDSVKDDADKYFDWYGVNGIFFDEVSPNDVSYYKSLRHHVEGHSGTQDVILNPGAPVPNSYEDAADIIIVHEGSGLPSSVTSNGIAESKLGVLSHGGNPSESEFKDATSDVKYVYGAPDWMHVASNIEDQADWAN
jgi:spherulation-specific family 4 protein